jgi:hypothetical protein
MKIQILGFALLLCSNFAFADDAAKTVVPKPPTPPAATPAPATPAATAPKTNPVEIPKIVKPSKDAPPKAETTKPAENKTATKPADAQTPVAPKPAESKGNTAAPIPKKDQVTATPKDQGADTLLARRIDRYSYNHTDCTIWANGLVKIDFDHEGLTGTVKKNLNLTPESMELFTQRLERVGKAEWEDHRGMYANTIGPDQWGLLYSTGEKPFYTSWGAVWMGGRVCNEMYPLKHFLDSICQF